MNATALCKSSGKKYEKWKQRKRSAEFLQILSNETGANLIDFKRGHRSEQKTWVHPRVAIDIANWISTEFAVSVTGWIMEWTKQHANNEAFTAALEAVRREPERECFEKQAVARLVAVLTNAQTEVATEYGLIDILTPTELIEVKVAPKWKHAIGQVLAYSVAYPEHTKRVHLIGMDECFELAPVQRVCDSLGVRLTHEPRRA